MTHKAAEAVPDACGERPDQENHGVPYGFTLVCAFHARNIILLLHQKFCVLSFLDFHVFICNFNFELSSRRETTALRACFCKIFACGALLDTL